MATIENWKKEIIKNSVKFIGKQEESPSPKEKSL